MERDQVDKLLHTEACCPMNEAGHSMTSIFMSGSQCQNDILIGLIASACDMPVVAQP
jgi:ribulose kinase